MAGQKKRVTPEQLSEASEKVLQALKKDKRPWATLSQIGLTTAAAREACKQLVKEQRIVPVGRVGRVDGFSFLRHSTVKEHLVYLAEGALHECGMGEQLVLLPLSKAHDTYRGVPSKVREQIVAGASRLIDRGEAFRVKVRNQGFIVLSANLASLLDTGKRGERRERPDTLETRPIDKARVIEAYTRLARERHSPHVIVSDLQREAGVPLDSLKEWLLAECRAHRAIPFLGEPSRATDEQLAAALLVEGQRHLYVRLVEEGLS